MRGTATPGRGRAFRRIRIAFLLVVLVFTAAWGAHRSWRRWSRGSWEQPIQVGLVLLSPGGDVDAESWRGGIDALSVATRRGDGALAGARAARHSRSRWSARCAGAAPSPSRPPTGSPLDRAWHAIDVWRTVRDIDRAAGGAAGGFDVRVFFLCDSLPGSPLGFAEGSGAVNGEVAFVRGSCGGDLSLSLQTIGHELLHTVGATDRYDTSGHARVPDGLADPGRLPLYPQVHAEWMAGEVALAPGRGRLPESLEELRVGEATAREIGWIR